MPSISRVVVKVPHEKSNWVSVTVCRHRSSATKGWRREKQTQSRGVHSTCRLDCFTGANDGKLRVPQGYKTVLRLSNCDSCLQYTGHSPPKQPLPPPPHKFGDNAWNQSTPFPSWEVTSRLSDQHMFLLWNLNFYYRIYNSPPEVPVLCQMNAVSTVRSRLSKIRFNIILLRPKLAVFFRFCY
jgi:hypothetical protein